MLHRCFLNSGEHTDGGVMRPTSRTILFPLLAVLFLAGCRKNPAEFDAVLNSTLIGVIPGSHPYPRLSVLEMGTKEVRLLGQATGTNTSFDWFQDGTHIAYSSINYPGSGPDSSVIYTVKTDGSAHKELLRLPGYSSNVKLYSQNEILFAKNDPLNLRSSVYHLSIADSRLEQVTPDYLDVDEFVLSPDKTYLCLRTPGYNGRTLWLFDIGTNTLEPISEEDRVTSTPAWHPSGKMIAYVQIEQNTNRSLIRYSLEDRLHFKIHQAYSITDIAWAPQGDQIMFVQWTVESGAGQIFTISPDGSGLRQWTHEGWHFTPKYLGVRNKILFAGHGSPRGMSLSLLDLDSGEISLLRHWEDASYLRFFPQPIQR